MLIRARKYAQIEKGYDAHMHQVVPPSAMTSGVHVPMAASIELVPTSLSTLSSTSTPKKQPSNQESLPRRGD